MLSVVNADIIEQEVVTQDSWISKTSKTMIYYTTEVAYNSFLPKPSSLENTYLEFIAR